MSTKNDLFENKSRENEIDTSIDTDFIGGKDNPSSLV